MRSGGRCGPIAPECCLDPADRGELPVGPGLARLRRAIEADIEPNLLERRGPENACGSKGCIFCVNTRRYCSYKKITIPSCLFSV